eukprot:scaffold126501_cov100-Cyclotella_meneghiniana.AAC.1
MTNPANCSLHWQVDTSCRVGTSCRKISDCRTREMMFDLINIEETISQNHIHITFCASLHEKPSVWIHGNVMIFFRNHFSSLLRMAIVIGIVLIPQSAAGLKMKGLKGVTVDENTHDKVTEHATFEGTISNDQGDTFGHDVDWYNIHEDVSLMLEDNNTPIKLGPVVDEKGWWDDILIKDDDNFNREQTTTKTTPKPANPVPHKSIPTSPATPKSSCSPAGRRT